MRSLRLRPIEERQHQPDDVAIAVWPTTLIDADRTHYLTQGTPTIVIFALANPLARSVKQGWILFDLPEGISLLATNAYLPWHLLQTKPIQRDGRAYVHYEVPCSVHPTTFPRGRGRGAWFHRYRPSALWLRTELAPGSRPGRVYYQFQYLDSGASAPARSPERWVDLGILPKVVAKQPTLAKAGVMGRFILNYNRTQTDVPQLITSYIKQLGYNYYMGYIPLPKQEASLARWAEGPIQNGFDIRGPEEIPEDIRYVAHDAQFPRAVTPSAIYRRHPWVVKSLFGRLRTSVLNQDFTSLWANWEPYAMLGNGDYSDRTRDEFIKWARLPAGEVKEGWPHAIVKRYSAEWRAFRNWELGQVTRTVAEQMTKIGNEAGVDSEFCIAMSNDAIWTDKMTADSHPCSVASWGDADYRLQTWSYYFVADSEGKYPVTDRCGAVQVARSGALERWMDAKLGENRKVRMGCLYGWDQTGGGGFFLPEQLGFLHLSAVFAGMDNTQNYAEWPIWDGRYAREVALANARIATWEDYILNGKKRRTHVVIPVSPYPERIPEEVKPPAQEVTGGWKRYLYSFEYHRDDRRLITVANTWDFGECFLRIRVPQLDAGKYRFLEPEARRAFTNANGEAELSASDLAQGVLVHVGATRWGAFLLEGARGDLDSGISRITPQLVEQALAKRTRALKLALVPPKEVAYVQNFESCLASPPLLESHPAGLLGKGTHGEKVVDDRLSVGYVGKPRWGADLHVRVHEEEDGKALRVVDNERGSGVYLKLALGLREGEVHFDYELLRLAPVSITLGAYEAVLTIPSPATWQKWFQHPYQPNFVYLAGAGPGVGYPKDRTAFRPTDTGVTAQAHRKYDFCIKWDNQTKKASVAIDGEHVVKDGPFLSRVFGITESIVWSASSFEDRGLADNGEFLVDNIKVLVRRR